MPKCKECAQYMAGGICRKKGATTLGVTCPIRKAGHCFEPIVELSADDHFSGASAARLPKSQRRGRGASRRPAKPEEYKNTKVCIKCGVEKPLAEFYRLTRSKDGHMNTCKKCWDKYNRRPRKNERV